MSDSVLTKTLVKDVASPHPRAISIGPFGSNLKSDLYTSSGVPVVRGQDITNTKWLNELGMPFVSQTTADNLLGCIVKRNDLIFPHRGAIGRVGIILNGEYLMSSSLMRLRCDPEKASALYLFYYFRGPGKEELLSRASTVGTPGIGQPLKSLRSIPLWLPPLGAQRSIAEILGALDDKIDANSKKSRLAENLARTHFASAATAAPKRAMSTVLSPILGGTPDRSRPEYWLGARPWASARDVAGAAHGVVLDTEEKITDIAIELTRAKPLPAGSVVLTARGTVGAVARLAVSASFNQSCYGFMPTVMPPGVLYFSILHAMTQAKSYAHGSVFSTITISTFDHLNIPIFETAITQRLEATLSALLAVTTASAQENTALAALRDTLLPELMSGRLRVRDAEEQVGEVL